MIVRSIGMFINQLSICRYVILASLEIQDQEKNLHAIEKDNSKAARRELDQFIRDTIADAKKMATNSVCQIARNLTQINPIKACL